MESIRAQRMKKIMQVRGEVGGKQKPEQVKILPNSHEILRKSVTADIQSQAIQDVTKQILQDDFNNLKAYDILKADTGDKGRQFKSVHSMYDLQTLKITKLYKKKKRSTLEAEIRTKLKEDPDKKLLLSEIYENLEENDDVVSIKKKKKDKEEENLTSGQVEYQEDETNDLRTWSKKLKDAKKSQSVEQLKIRGTRRAPTDIIRVSPITRPTEASSKDKLLRAVKKINIQKDQSKDLEIQKQVEQYMNKAQSVDINDIKQLGEIKSEGDIQNQFDFSVEGVQRSYNTLIKVQVSSFRSESEKAKFYKKQSTVILNRLNNKIKTNQQTIIFKENTLQKLRLENHEILDKMNQIKELLYQLSQELNSLIDPNRRENTQNSSVQKKKRDSVVTQIMIQSNRQREIEKDMDVLKESLIAYKQKLQFNKKAADLLDKEVYEIKKETKHINNSLISFYYYLLQQGQDCRNTGTAWIIVCLKRLNEKVQLKYLPIFLDQKAKEYLLSKSLILEEVEELEKELSESFKTYKQESADNSLSMAFRNQSMNESLEMSLPSIFPPDSNKLSAIDIQQAKIEATRNNRSTYSLQKLGPITLGLTAEQVEALEVMLGQLNQQNQPITANRLIYSETQKKITQAIKGAASTSRINTQSAQSIIDQAPSNLDQSSLLKEQAIKHYDQANNKLIKIKHKLQQLEDEQLHRIIKEFDYKSYSKRFNIDPITVLSCLFGGPICDREIVKNGLKKMNYQ